MIGANTPARCCGVSSSKSLSNCARRRLTNPAAHSFNGFGGLFAVPLARPPIRPRPSFALRPILYYRFGCFSKFTTFYYFATINNIIIYPRVFNSLSGCPERWLIPGLICRQFAAVWAGPAHSIQGRRCRSFAYLRRYAANGAYFRPCGAFSLPGRYVVRVGTKQAVKSGLYESPTRAGVHTYAGAHLTAITRPILRRYPTISRANSVLLKHCRRSIVRVYVRICARAYVRIRPHY